MATPFTAFRPSPIICSASSNRRKPPTTSSANWWTPLFGWPSDPDYIVKEPVAETRHSFDSDPGRARSRFGLGCFTEEKAKELRRKTAEITTFHDVMYHSAIASRLASGTASENILAYSGDPVIPVAGSIISGELGLGSDLVLSFPLQSVDLKV